MTPSRNTPPPAPHWHVGQVSVAGPASLNRVAGQHLFPDGREAQAVASLVLLTTAPQDSFARDVETARGGCRAELAAVAARAAELPEAEQLVRLQNQDADLARQLTDVGRELKAAEWAANQALALGEDPSSAEAQASALRGKTETLTRRRENLAGIITSARHAARKRLRQDLDDRRRELLAAARAEAAALEAQIAAAAGPLVGRLLAARAAARDLAAADQLTEQAAAGHFEAPRPERERPPLEWQLSQRPEAIAPGLLRAVPTE